MKILKSKEVQIKAVTLGILVVVAAGAAYLVGLIDQKTMLSLTGFFGYGSIAAIRALFQEQGKKTYLIVGAVVAVTAVFTFGFIEEFSWATAEKLQVLLEIMGIPALAGLLHGVAKSNGFSTVGQTKDI